MIFFEVGQKYLANMYYICKIFEIKIFLYFQIKFSLNTWLTCQSRWSCVPLRNPERGSKNIGGISIRLLHDGFQNDS